MGSKPAEDLLAFIFNKTQYRGAFQDVLVYKVEKEFENLIKIAKPKPALCGILEQKT